MGEANQAATGSDSAEDRARPTVNDFRSRRCVFDALIPHLLSLNLSSFISPTKNPKAFSALGFDCSSSVGVREPYGRWLAKASNNNGKRLPKRVTGRISSSKFNANNLTLSGEWPRVKGGGGKLRHHLPARFRKQTRPTAPPRDSRPACIPMLPNPPN